MNKCMKTIIAASLCLASFSLFAATISVPIYLTAKPGEQGKSVGTITFTDTPYGMLIRPNLYDLPIGIRGFHVHEKNSCANLGAAAGGHYDPAKTGMHLGPYNSEGELGDLPALTVMPEKPCVPDKSNKNQVVCPATGECTLPVLAPRLKVAMLQGRSIMIHAGGDNYSDQPEPLGGGGARLACGVVSTRALASPLSRGSDVSDASATGSSKAVSSQADAGSDKDDSSVSKAAQ